MPPTTSGDQLAAASVHYHAGRYGQAAGAFRSIADASATPPSASGNSAQPPGPGGTSSSRKRKIEQCSDDYEGGSMANGISRIFAALPSLSMGADAALSAARSALAGRESSKGSASDGTSAAQKVKAALDANATYRAALLSASMALRRLKIGHSDANDNNNRNANQYQCQVAVSFLMAGTSASWLHLSIGDGPSAQEVLIDSLRGAASCFFEVEGTGSGGDVLPPAMLPMTNEEAWNLIQKGLMDNDHNNVDTNEKERCQIAFRTFCNAMRVAYLGNDARIGIPIPINVSKTDDNGESKNSGVVEEEIGCVGLRRQELLIRALTLHRSLKGLSDDAVCTAKRKERDTLLKEATSLEAHLGPARRLQILLDGLKALSFPTTSEDSASASPSDTIAGLKALASSSRTARAMLGCIYALRGQHALALDVWQKTLEMNSDDTGSREYQATVLGMANCFVMLGEATPAEELLLHLNAISSVSTLDDGPSISRPLKISLGDGDITTSSSEADLMWRIFFVSTLAEDWVTCLAAAENLTEKTGGKNSLCKDLSCARGALIFSLLQCHRQSDALDKYVEWSKDDVGGPLGALLSLYEADGFISVGGGEGGGKELETKVDGKGVSVVHDKCRLAIEKQFESGDTTEEVVSDGDSYSNVLLDIATDNNQGISLILEGNTKEALLAFEDASKARPGSDLLLLRPRFNKSLLLWREGYKSEATKVWMGTRNIEDAGLKLHQGNDLRAKMEEAITRHALYCAKKRSTPGDALGIAADEAKITPWRSDDAQNIGDEEKTSHLSGMDLEQILAFDVVVLQHAVTEPSRKESSRNSFL